MKNIFKRISAAVIAIAMTIMMIPMSENAKVFAVPINWIDSANITWYNDTDTTFSIDTPEKLAGLASLVNGGNSFSGKEINLTADIVLNSGTIDASSAGARAWTPIGTTSNKFLGTFDGNSHTVSGIYINNTNQYIGLFGVSNGTIENVGIINSYIKGNSYVGGIVGRNLSGTVTNCYNEGTIIGNFQYVGGVVGSSSPIDGTTKSTVENCYNTGAVTSQQFVGGIAGENQESTISNCHNTGTVTATFNNSCGGGVVGWSYSNSEITNCYNTGTVSGKVSLGGVAGNNNATITSCYNTGTVNGTDNVGGVAGYNNATISNCYNTGTVNGTDNVGGVAGLNLVTITNCYYHGYNVGVGGSGASQDGTTPFVKINDNPLGTGKTTTITEQATSTINTAWSSALGANYTVTFSDNYTSSDTNKATVSGAIITGVAAGNPSITSRKMTITQNELTSAGFTGATKTIEVTISLPLNVTAEGGGTLPASAPTVTPGAAIGVGTTTATLNGTVNANNADATVSFEYGATTAYGTTVNASPNSVTGNTNTSVSASLSGLTDSTTYHYRVKATNSEGTSEGADMTFTTIAAPKYTVTFNSNGGSAVTSLTNVVSGSKISAPTPPTKSGFAFAGWYKDNNTFANAWNFGTDTVTSAVTLFAKWTANSTPPAPAPTSDPTPTPEKKPEKTIKVIETPTGIENPQLIGVTASDNAFNESVEVRLKDDPAAKQAVEQALAEKFDDITKDTAIFLDILKLVLIPIDFSSFADFRCSVIISSTIEESPSMLFLMSTFADEIYIFSGGFNIIYFHYQSNLSQQILHLHRLKARPTAPANI